MYFLLCYATVLVTMQMQIFYAKYNQLTNDDVLLWITHLAVHTLMYLSFFTCTSKVVLLVTLVEHFFGQVLELYFSIVYACASLKGSF